MSEWELPSIWHTTHSIAPERRTAIHEAGHSTFLIKEFGGLDKVTIIGTENYNGYTKSNEGDSQEHFLSLPAGQERKRFAKRCTMLLCGPAAVEKAVGTLLFENVKNDLADLYDLLQTVADTDAELDRLTNRVWGEARRFVKKEWRAIEAVADALIEQKTLNGAQVREVIESAEKRKASTHDNRSSAV